jgi:hypothetical protein
MAVFRSIVTANASGFTRSIAGKKILISFSDVGRAAVSLADL